MANGPGAKEIKINVPEKVQAGVYANNMIVAHTREEFILDFLMVAPPAGTVTARVIVSPGHMKRILEALRDNLSNTSRVSVRFERPKNPNPRLVIHEWR